jgi:hypothetical protein
LNEWLNLDLAMMGKQPEAPAGDAGAKDAAAGSAKGPATNSSGSASAPKR